jgi:hypothetical protein
MDNKFINKTVRLLSVPVSLFILLLPFSFLTGWNSATMVVYWIFITPFVAEYVPTIFSNKKDQLADSLIGMLIFYSFIVLLTYKQFQTDFFSFIVVSFIINIVSITVISKVKKVYGEPSY